MDTRRRSALDSHPGIRARRTVGVVRFKRRDDRWVATALYDPAHRTQSAKDLGTGTDLAKGILEAFELALSE